MGLPDSRQRRLTCQMLKAGRPYIRYMVRSPKPLTLPRQVGPCQITWLGSLVAIRCPKDLDRIVGRTAATWEPGSGRWLVSPSRAAKLVPKLRRATDTLFRQAGLDLDDG
jgi:hypothetical protein